MVTALVLIGAALLTVLAAALLLRGRSRRAGRPRPIRREMLSRRFNFDRYKLYEHK
ncbi:hypothetical protein G3N56_11920 [Desulfovibrio sulfodismutans]|uniref:Uncharacterized protein n=1 Tax=Desulfolutivibrio sulfodismutans TaxID=63561 RepID=A0A7K3NMU2_9BACT|nr:hypothetical protein [Desulfolutivibrio sulfodismutans]NDY57447.1 hypothetical protein [Desulfolutivibrio sulfodismutans]